MTAGPSRKGFDIDLREGEAQEQALVHVFLQSLVEVKSDHKAAHTGNVFVEYEQPSGPSGIATTTAHWWAFQLVGLGWVILPTDRLKALARQAMADPRRRVNGGDRNRYKGVLVPVEWLVRPFKTERRAA